MCKLLTDDYNTVERLTNKKTTKYNKDLYVASCAICGAKVDDVHHIKEQKTKDEKGFIGHINGFLTTSRGLELQYTQIGD